jgi:hypothetical protein
MITLMADHTDEILNLQKSIRALLTRKNVMEKVHACDKETVSKPYSTEITTDGEDAKEELFISQQMVNQCLESEFGVQTTILKYFQNKEDIKDLESILPERISSVIDRKRVYGYYKCDGKEAYAYL